MRYDNDGLPPIEIGQAVKKYTIQTAEHCSRLNLQFRKQGYVAVLHGVQVKSEATNQSVNKRNGTWQNLAASRSARDDESQQILAAARKFDHLSAVRDRWRCVDQRCENITYAFGCAGNLQPPNE